MTAILPGMDESMATGAGHQIASNSEQGTGRADVVVRDRRNRRAVIIETKCSRSHKELLSDCEKAREQIENKRSMPESF